MSELSTLSNEVALLPPGPRTGPAPDVPATAAAWWAAQAAALVWDRPWTAVCAGDLPDARWFVGGALNLTRTALDANLRDRPNQAALIWEGEPGDGRVLTYRQLHREVEQLVGVLRRWGVQKGDRVAIYLPLAPEAVVAMLACARVGAVHSVVFGGFSAQALADRIQDAGAKVLITADGGWRRGKVVPLKHIADEALRQCPDVTRVLVWKRGVPGDIGWHAGRDAWWHDEVGAPDPTVASMESDDPLFILYTSGTTGKPKGVLHGVGGYGVGVAATTRWVFDLTPQDVYWCTADVGWITGHSYVTYGPLLNGATVFLYEGALDWPEVDKAWELCARHGVTVLYTAPTAIRAFMVHGDEPVARHDLSAIRLLGSVGEPINPEAWRWYRSRVGGDRVHVVDTWWQTETGHILLTTLPGVDPMRPGTAGPPFPGVALGLRDNEGAPVSLGAGFLVADQPWPGMLLGVWGDRARFLEAYFSRFPGIYFTGDGARVDELGHYTLLGRVDDVLNIAGHRIGTAEVESALVAHPAVAEAAAVGVPHAIKGQALAVFVTLRAGFAGTIELEAELRAHVSTQIGAIARPDRLIFTPSLPKTRSGKIMRRLLRDLAQGRAGGDTTTLADPTVMDTLRAEYEKVEA